MIGNPHSIVFFEFDKSPDSKDTHKPDDKYLQITMVNDIGNLNKGGPKQKIIRLNDTYQHELYEILKSKFG